MHQRFSHRLRMALLLTCFGWGLSFAHAQAQTDGDDNADLDQIEAEIKKGTPKNANSTNGDNKGAATTEDPQKLTDLSKLAPFSEVSVLQKRFMPKTQRFQAYLGLSALMNDPWFTGIGGTAKLAYHFSEDWGVEGSFLFLSNSQRDSVKDLHNNNGVDTSSLVMTKGFYGIDVFWSPIYGKMSLYNKRIIPFDMYFTGGLGQSQYDGGTAAGSMTYHFGTGQIYSLSKAWGFRWAFDLNTFNATTKDKKTGLESSSQFNNLMLSLGASFFFPEAKYR